LTEGKVDFDLHETIRPGDATNATRAALHNGVTTIAVVGGDGTLSEAAEGFFEFNSQNGGPPSAINSEASLAVLPAGTGDDFARGLRPKVRLREWMELFIAHVQHKNHRSTKTVDILYGSCDNYALPFICLNASTMGIGGETAARVAAQRKLMRILSGEVRFMTAAIGALAAWRERRVRVSVDDTKVIDSSMNLVAVANGLYAGGGMMLSPEARLDDGKLDVITACGLTRTAVIRELPRIHSGGHLANPKVNLTQGTSVRIETFTPEDALLIEVDGNVRGRTPAEFKVMPASLQFVA
jgi:YegS/Rv2252/BmrU family lipid kinase